MSPGEKQAWLLDQALDVKREILTLPMPDPNDDSIEAHRTRMLVLSAADTTIEQTIRINTKLKTNRWRRTTDMTTDPASGPYGRRITCHLAGCVFFWPHNALFGSKSINLG